jgi:ferredoxin
MSNQAFTVVLARSGQEFEIGAGESILEVLLKNGVNAASYCREGECGTCIVKVLEGEPHHKDFVLSESERASNGLMTICVSGSKSKRLVIDL